MNFEFVKFSDKFPVDLVSEGKNYEQRQYEILVRPVGGPSYRGFFRNHPTKGVCLESRGELLYKINPDDTWIYYEDWLANGHPSKDASQYVNYINLHRRPRLIHPYEKEAYLKSITPGDW